MSEAQLSIPTYLPPVLSVIVPVGPGHEEFVMDAVDSCEAQTMQQLEVIVVNDSGNKLHLPNWVKEIIIPDAPKGVANARNVGIAASAGRFILPLDADDILQPNAVKTFWEYSEVNPGVILYSDFWEDPNEKNVFKRFYTDDYDPKLLITRGAIATVTCFIPREVIEKVGAYDVDMIAWEDWAFMLKCAENGICFARIPKPLFTYRKHTGKRAKDNVLHKEENKEQILSKFGQFWNGEKDIMACSKCSEKRAVSPVAEERRTAAALSPLGVSGEMVLLEYSTQRLADAEFRAPSGQRYNFGNGDRKYVLTKDATFFLSIDGFKDATPSMGAEDLSPVLVSSNPA